MGETVTGLVEPGFDEVRRRFYCDNVLDLLGSQAGRLAA